MWWRSWMQYFIVCYFYVFWMLFSEYLFRCFSAYEKIVELYKWYNLKTRLFKKYISTTNLKEPRSNRTVRKRPETAVVIRQSRNVYKNGAKRWSFRSKKRPETAVVIRTDGLRWNRVKIKAVSTKRSYHRHHCHQLQL